MCVAIPLNAVHYFVCIDCSGKHMYRESIKSHQMKGIPPEQITPASSE